MKKITKITVYYDDGTFEDTYKWGSPNPIPATPYQGTQPYTWSGYGCKVCGVGKNGTAMGYVCNRPDCPTRFTCQSFSIPNWGMHEATYSGARGESNE